MNISERNRATFGYNATDMHNAMIPSNFSVGSGGSWGSATPKTTATPVAKEDPQGYFDEHNWLNGNNQDFFKNYESSYYQRPSAENFAQQASEFRQLYEEPQRRELTNKLEQAITDAESQLGRIGANYASFYEALQNREAQQRSFDLESAIARGAGRSGVVNFMDRQRDNDYAAHYSNAMAQKMGEKNAVQNQLALIQRQVPGDLIALAEQASRLESQELQRLQDLDYTRGMQYDQDQWGRAMGVYDRTMLTPLEALQLYIAMADVAGKFPSAPPTLRGI